MFKIKAEAVRTNWTARQEEALLNCKIPITSVDCVTFIRMQMIQYQCFYLSSVIEIELTNWSLLIYHFLNINANIKAIHDSKREKQTILFLVHAKVNL